MKTSGFTLLEVLIATAIAALLGYAIMLVLYQINRVQPTINRYTEPYFGALIMQQHLLHDCSGIEVPLTQWLAIAQKQKEHEKAKEKKKGRNRRHQRRRARKRKKGQNQKKKRVRKKYLLLKIYLC